jgi:hypothetical protein
MKEAMVYRWYAFHLPLIGFIAAAAAPAGVSAGRTETAGVPARDISWYHYIRYIR